MWSYCTCSQACVSHTHTHTAGSQHKNADHTPQRSWSWWEPRRHTASHTSVFIALNHTHNRSVSVPTGLDFKKSGGMQIKHFGLYIFIFIDMFNCESSYIYFLKHNFALDVFILLCFISQYEILYLCCPSETFYFFP